MAEPGGGKERDGLPLAWLYGRSVHIVTTAVCHIVSERVLDAKNSKVVFLCSVIFRY